MIPGKMIFAVLKLALSSTLVYVYVYVVWDGKPRRTSPITVCRSPRFLVASICDPPVAVNSSFDASVAALSALVLSPLRAQQFGILCLTVYVIQLLGLISFDVT